MRSAFACASLLSVALTVTPDTAAAQQRPAGLVPSADSIEGGLWTVSDRTERDARQSAELNPDPELTAYVRQVACTVGPEYCDELRVYVMDRPAFNASAAPNGYIEVWSGLLLRADSEAELAFVVGHEIGHYAENHTVEQWNTTKAWSTAALVVGVGVGVAGAYYQVDTTGFGDLVYLTAMSSIFSYGRGQELQADHIGFDRLVAAGYDSRAAADVWRGLQDETKHSSFASVRRRDAANSIFRTHPLTEDRVSALEAMAESHPEAGRLERAKYRAVIRPHLGRWLTDELTRRDFDGLLVLIDRLERDGEDLGVLEFHRGEALRLRRKEGDAVLARDAYAKASAYPDAPIQVWRELGDLQARLSEPTAARQSYEKYLQLAADSDDRWIVEDSLKSLEATND